MKPTARPARTRWRPSLSACSPRLATFRRFLALDVETRPPRLECRVAGCIPPAIRTAAQWSPVMAAIVNSSSAIEVLRCHKLQVTRIVQCLAMVSQNPVDGTGCDIEHCGELFARLTAPGTGDDLRFVERFKSCQLSRGSRPILGTDLVSKPRTLSSARRAFLLVSTAPCLSNRSSSWVGFDSRPFRTTRRRNGPPVNGGLFLFAGRSISSSGRVDPDAKLLVGPR
jgi:hypothetical protein